MLRILLVLTAIFYLGSGPGKPEKPKPSQKPLSVLFSCGEEENRPPPQCWPDCGC